MSARTLEKPELESPRSQNFTAPPRRSSTKARPKAELTFDVKIQPVRRSRIKKSIFERVFLGTATFAAVAFGSYLASGLMAQVKAEGARQSGIQASQRAEAAVRSGQAVSARLQKVTALGAIDRWAQSHGMLKHGPAPEERKLVVWRD